MLYSNGFADGVTWLLAKQSQIRPVKVLIMQAFSLGWQ
jgi:hypothetical protein